MIVVVVRDRLIPLPLQEIGPAIVSAQSPQTVGTEQQVRAATADLGIRIEAGIAAVAIGQLQPQAQSARHVRRKTRVGGLDANIADGAVIEAHGLAATLVRSLKIT